MSVPLPLPPVGSLLRRRVTGPLSLPSRSWGVVLDRSSSGSLPLAVVLWCDGSTSHEGSRYLTWEYERF